MKRSLLAICLAASNLVSAQADQLKLNGNLMAGGVEKIEYSSKCAGNKTLIHVRAWTERGQTTSGSRKGSYTNLIFKITNGKTTINLADYGADGVSKNDRLVVHHDFGTAILNINAQYLGKYNYRVDCILRYNEDGLELRKQYDTSSPFWNVLARIEKLEEVAEWGREIYLELVNATNEGREPKLPERAIIEGLDEMGKLLPRLRSKNKDEKEESKAGLKKLAMDFLKHTKARELK